MSTIQVTSRPGSSGAHDYWVVSQTGEFTYDPIYGPYTTFAAAEIRRDQVRAERGRWHDQRTLPRLRRRQQTIARTLANLRGLGGAIATQMEREFYDIEHERASAKLHRMRCKGCGGEPVVQ